MRTHSLAKPAIASMPVNVTFSGARTHAFANDSEKSSMGRTFSRWMTGNRLEGIHAGPSLPVSSSGV
eukprot:651401-Alexandrium_andersonii.AAC.1